MLSIKQRTMLTPRLLSKRHGSFRTDSCSPTRSVLPSAASNSIHTSSQLILITLLRDHQRLDATSKSRIRSFGHVKLCGVLHACWKTTDGVKGSYMVCLLYREWLCLASAAKSDQLYTIQACIALQNIHVEEVDNGRGRQAR